MLCASARAAERGKGEGRRRRRRERNRQSAEWADSEAGEDGPVYRFVRHNIVRNGFNSLEIINRARSVAVSQALPALKTTQGRRTRTGGRGCSNSLPLPSFLPPGLLSLSSRCRGIHHSRFIPCSLARSLCMPHLEGATVPGWIMSRVVVEKVSFHVYYRFGRLAGHHWGSPAACRPVNNC